MDFDPVPDDHPLRLAARGWLARHRGATAADLVAAGWVVPHWPAPWGLDADAAGRAAVAEELERAGVALPYNPIGRGWAAPTLLAGGDAEQQQRWIPGALSGEEFWCQLFSEPGAGSDLAGLSTKAERAADGSDDWIVTGQKIWTSGAERARWGILIARTDPAAPRHRGLSYFVCDMTRPGIDVRPIVEMSGGTHFTEVFFDGVRLPADHLVGQPGEGWRLAVVTLANERVSLTEGGVLWGDGPTSTEVLELILAAGGTGDPLHRQDAARCWTEATLLRLLAAQGLTRSLRGQTPGPEASVRKLLADHHGQRLLALASRLAGTHALMTDWGPLGTPAERPWGTWHWAEMFTRALTIGGGTAEVQRSIIGERILGLPRSSQ